MNKIGLLITLIACGMLAQGCGDEDPCNPGQFCERDADDRPMCMEGYVWENPSDNNNLTCVEAVAGTGSTLPGSCSGGTSGGTSGDGTSGDGTSGNGSNDDNPCPPNSHLEGDSCYCDDGFVVNEDGTACVEASDSDNPCPPNSHLEGDSCYCDEGFVVNEDQTACVPQCTTDADCDPGMVCIDNTCRPPPCTPGSCDEGMVCDEESGYCIADIGTLPLEPALDCDVLPSANCEDDDLTCIPDWRCTSNCSEIIQFEAISGDGYWNYPLNGETWGNQYRSFVRRDVMMLVKYASASVRCMSQNWTFGNQEPLGLGDMSEANGDIPGESIGQPGHPEGTHVNGHDMDIAYYQMNPPDNKLRSVCEHTINGQDQYHCVAPPNNLDVWRTALFLAKVQDTPAFRVVGVDGQIGPLVESAISQMCGAGWISGSACSSPAVAYEVTNTQRGWYYFHHHHFHISVSGSNRSVRSEPQHCLTPECGYQDFSYDRRWYIYRDLFTPVRN